MTKILAALKIGWVIGQAAGWALFGCALVSVAGEPFRVEPRPLTVPLPDEPTEKNPPPADQAGNAATGIDPPVGIDARHAPADPSEDLPPVPKRPLVYLYTSIGCTAGDQMRSANARGEFVGLDIEERPAPDWYTLCPTFHWQSANGSWVKYPRDATDYRGVGGMLAAFDRANPGERFKAVASRGAGAPLTSASQFDQMIKFTGPSGKFSFIPDTPIAAMLDDRTSITFKAIQGRYTVNDGIMTVKLDQPHPVGAYHKWIDWGFEIIGGSGPRVLNQTVSELTIDTNRGSQKVTIQMEPVK